MTTAVILAAGLGSRLRPLTDDRPKCLMDLGGETILGRMVRLLGDAGVTSLVIATGYLPDALHRALAGCALPVRFVHCADYATTQNVVSLHRALSVIDAGDVVKLDGDVVFPVEVLTRLRAAMAGGGAVAVDDREPPRDEAMKVRVEHGVARAFGKGLAAHTCAGESIGVEWFDDAARAHVAAAIARAVSSGRTDVYYEDVYNDAVDAVAMRCVSVGDLAWTEVDDVSDLARARSLVATAR